MAGDAMSTRVFLVAQILIFGFVWADASCGSAFVPDGARQLQLAKLLPPALANVVKLQTPLLDPSSPQLRGDTRTGAIWLTPKEKKVLWDQLSGHLAQHHLLLIKGAMSRQACEAGQSREACYSYQNQELPAQESLAAAVKDLQVSLLQAWGPPWDISTLATFYTQTLFPDLRDELYARLLERLKPSKHLKARTKTTLLDSAAYGILTLAVPDGRIPCCADNSECDSSGTCGCRVVVADASEAGCGCAADSGSPHGAQADASSRRGAGGGGSDAASCSSCRLNLKENAVHSTPAGARLASYEEFAATNPARKGSSHAEKAPHSGITPAQQKPDLKLLLTPSAHATARETREESRMAVSGPLLGKLVGVCSACCYFSGIAFAVVFSICILKAPSRARAWQRVCIQQRVAAGARRQVQPAPITTNTTLSCQQRSLVPSKGPSRRLYITWYVGQVLSYAWCQSVAPFTCFLQWWKQLWHVLCGDKASGIGANGCLTAGVDQGATQQQQQQQQLPVLPSACNSWWHKASAVPKATLLSWLPSSWTQVLNACVPAGELSAVASRAPDAALPGNNTAAPAPAPAPAPAATTCSHTAPNSSSSVSPGRLDAGCLVPGRKCRASSKKAKASSKHSVPQHNPQSTKGHSELHRVAAVGLAAGTAAAAAEAGQSSSTISNKTKPTSAGAGTGAGAGAAADVSCSAAKSTCSSAAVKATGNGPSKASAAGGLSDAADAALLLLQQPAGIAGFQPGARSQSSTPAAAAAAQSSTPAACTARKAPQNLAAAAGTAASVCCSSAAACGAFKQGCMPCRLQRPFKQHSKTFTGPGPAWSREVAQQAAATAATAAPAATAAAAAAATAHAARVSSYSSADTSVVLPLQQQQQRLLQQQQQQQQQVSVAVPAAAPQVDGIAANSSTSALPCSSTDQSADHVLARALPGLFAIKLHGRMNSSDSSTGGCSSSSNGGCSFPSLGITTNSISGSTGTGGGEQLEYSPLASPYRPSWNSSSSGSSSSSVVGDWDSTCSPLASPYRPLQWSAWAAAVSSYEEQSETDGAAAVLELAPTAGGEVLSQHRANTTPTAAAAAAHLGPLVSGQSATAVSCSDAADSAGHADLAVVTAADDDGEESCVICWEALPTHGLLHDGFLHLCLCSSCCEMYDHASKGCPVCRQPVAGVVPVCMH